MKIPLTTLGIIIGVYFIILDEEVPTLVSNKDMID